MKPAKSDDARSLLQIVRHDDDRVIRLQLLDGLLDFGRRDGVDRGAGFVEKKDFRLDGDGPRDAEPLLLTSRKIEAVFGEVVFHFVPQRGTAKRRLDFGIELATRQLATEADAERDVA